MNEIRTSRAAPAKAARTLKAAVAAVLLASSCIALASCGSSEAKEAEKRRIAGLKAEVASLEGELKAAPDGGARVGCLRAILFIEVMQSGELESAIKRFEKNSDMLSGDLMSRIYIAVAESMMAGKVKKIEDKLSWLMKGMRRFDDLREEFPDDENVLLYQASTYANFPAEVGSRDEVLDILGAMAERYAAGRWRMSEGVAAQLAYVYRTLGSIYADDESAASIRESREAFAAAVPQAAPALGEAR